MIKITRKINMLEVPLKTEAEFRRRLARYISRSDLPPDVRFSMQVATLESKIRSNNAPSENTIPFTRVMNELARYYVEAYVSVIEKDKELAKRITAEFHAVESIISGGYIPLPADKPRLTIPSELLSGPCETSDKASRLFQAIFPYLKRYDPSAQEIMDKATLTLYTGAAERVKADIKSIFGKRLNAHTKKVISHLDGCKNLFTIARLLAMNMPSGDIFNAGYNWKNYMDATYLTSDLISNNKCHFFTQYWLASRNSEVKKAAEELLAFKHIMEALHYSKANLPIPKDLRLYFAKREPESIDELNLLAMRYGATSCEAGKRSMLHKLEKKVYKDEPGLFKDAASIVAGIQINDGHYSEAYHTCKLHFPANNIITLALIEKVDLTLFSKTVREDLGDLTASVITTSFDPKERTALPKSWRVRARFYDWNHAYHAPFVREFPGLFKE